MVNALTSHSCGTVNNAARFIRPYNSNVCRNCVAKLFEHFDVEVYNLLGFISGHSLKHITAALGLYVLLIFYEKRNCVHPATSI